MLHLIDTLRPGGAEQLLLTTMRHLDRARFQPMVAVLGPPLDLQREIEALGVPVVVLDALRPAQWFGGILRLARLLRRDKIEILHTHLRFSNVLGRLAAVLSHTPVVIATLHDLTYTNWPPVRPAARLWKGLDLMTALAINDGFIAVSEAVREDYVRHFGLRDIRLVYNYLDLDTLQSMLPSVSDARRQLGVDDWEFVLLSTGRLSPEKGHSHLLRAMADVVRTIPTARLMLVGEGSQMAALKSLARNLGIDNRVAFLGNRRDIPTLLAAADLFVFPSTTEALGIALLEGMAAGLPVIASRVGGISEILHDGVDGLLVPPGDHAALTAAVIRLHESPALRGSLGCEARRAVSPRFSVDVGLRAVEAMYATLAPRRRRVEDSQ